MFGELKRSETTQDIFTDEELILSSRQPPNLKNLLTRAKFCSNEQGGVNKCSSPRCKLCNIIIIGNSYFFKNVDINFKILTAMTCDVLNCVYVLECGGCGKYYIGETNNFRLRTNLHRDHASKNTGLDVSRHIFKCTRDNFCANNFRIMPFYKVKNDDCDLRRDMEAYFINKLKPDLNSLK